MTKANERKLRAIIYYKLRKKRPGWTNKQLIIGVSKALRNQRKE